MTVQGVINELSKYDKDLNVRMFWFNRPLITKISIERESQLMKEINPDAEMEYVVLYWGAMDNDIKTD